MILIDKKKFIEIAETGEIQKIEESDIVDEVIQVIKLLIPAENYNTRTIKRILSKVIEHFKHCVE